MYEENLKEESIHKLSKSTDHFEEDQVAKAIQKKIIFEDTTRIILLLAAQFVYLLFLVTFFLC